MAVDIYLKLDGLPGESHDSKHKDWIQVLSFSHGLSMSGSMYSGGGQSTSGRVDVSDASVMKRVDKASPKLNWHCCTGTHIKSACIEFCQSTKDKHVFMKYSFEDIVVSSVQPSASSGGDFPMESLAFRFSKIEWEYTPMDEKGGKLPSSKAWWDVMENKGG
ncbi:MAG: type VI secretion system tube protein Hcp [Phycisphaerales bacterium]|nr:type VI secretion system tube protein Hcp [Phycisphaerales bacterium]